jgi:WD40 repeat protein
VSSVAFSSDGAYIVSGSWDYTVRIWDIVSGTVQHTLEGYTSGVTSVACSSDGSHIVPRSWDFSVRIWDANTGAMESIIEECYSPLSLRDILGESTSAHG